MAHDQARKFAPLPFRPETAPQDEPMLPMQLPPGVPETRERGLSLPAKLVVISFLGLASWLVVGVAVFWLFRALQ